MIDFDDEVYEEYGIKGILMQLAQHILFILVGGLLLFLPCYLIFMIAINSE